MGGPARVGHADVAGGEWRPVADLGFEGADAADGAADVHLALAVDDRDPRRVIPPVFQTLEAFDQKWLRNLAPDVRDNPAHAITTLSGLQPLIPVPIQSA